MRRIALVFSASALLAWVALAPRDTAPRMPGRHVEVAGDTLHVVEQGLQHRSGPTVVLETGFSAASFGWAWVQPEVARFARVIAYDRPGLGWSAASSGPRDADAAARRLHALLEGIEAPQPYVLVGHSLGGAIVRRFAALYPNEVGAVVLIDAVHPDQVERLDAYHYRHPESVVALGRLLVRMRLVSLFGVPDAIDELPPAARSAANHFVRSPGHWAAMAREAEAFHRSLAQLRDTSLAEIPLIVLTATEGRLPGWLALQRELAALSRRGELRAPPGTNHYGLATDRRQATHSIAAIRDAWRTVALLGAPSAQSSRADQAVQRLRRSTRGGRSIRSVAPPALRSFSNRRQATPPFFISRSRRAPDPAMQAPTKRLRCGS
jgi:pimeloyl-ACP methyl ester carboxylesterase